MFQCIFHMYLYVLVNLAHETERKRFRFVRNGIRSCGELYIFTHYNCNCGDKSNNKKPGHINVTIDTMNMLIFAYTKSSVCICILCVCFALFSISLARHEYA